MYICMCAKTIYFYALESNIYVGWGRIWPWSHLLDSPALGKLYYSTFCCSVEYNSIFFQ